MGIGILYGEWINIRFLARMGIIRIINLRIVNGLGIIRIVNLRIVNGMGIEICKLAYFNGVLIGKRNRSGIFNDTCLKIELIDHLT